MSAIEVSRLEVGYGAERPVLSGLEFAIPSGSVVAVLGPNGGGKTTLFRGLLGEAPRSAGSVEINGRIAYVPQTERARLDFPVAAVDVVLMGTYETTPWYRRIGAAQRQVALEALARVGLSEVASTRFGRLSGGQRQRVLIARALARRASVFLLDEPLSGVDRPSGQRILDLLGELAGEGCSVLVATHDIEQARGFDLVLCLNGGQVAFGDPAEVLSTDVLRRTYGAELIVLEDSVEAIVVQHHEH